MYDFLLLNIKEDILKNVQVALFSKNENDQVCQAPKRILE